MRFLFLIFGCGLLFSACDTNRVYEYNKEFSDRTWKMKDTAVFDFQIKNAEQKYNLYYNVRNTIDYPYARLFINYALTDSVGNVLSKKLINNDLFDQKTGRPNGNSGLGDIYDHQFLLLDNLQFAHNGKYRLKLEQYMRKDTLPGVIAVGFRLEHSEK
ncbi:MAG: gliding motility lipoprotein GldH [Azospira oryzae]|jgi:gliding motility-associated lipoprotein GldH|nr:gliding motility lipoprotein GldH [Cytophaga sp.]PZR40111.1 MAG: gliding motility lipoprotein GldH [Azospira oryzae]